MLLQLVMPGVRFSNQHKENKMFDDPDTPLTFAYQLRQENLLSKPHRLTAPDSDFQEILPLNINWQEAPDPIRQSDFWAAGNKIKPDAHMSITSDVWFGFGNAPGEETFHIGKLIGYFKTPMHQGGQKPSLIRANIQEPYQTTFGALYEVSPQVQAAGPAFTASGFVANAMDGYPY